MKARFGLVILIGLCAQATSAEEAHPIQTTGRILYSNDFERLPLGPVDMGHAKPGPQGPEARMGLVDNTYTGNRVEYRIVETDGPAGKALRIESDGFAQFILGPPVKVEQGTRYRSADKVSARTVLAVWAVDSEVTRVVLPAKDGADISCIGLFGRPVQVQRRDGQLDVPVSRMPVYVTKEGLP